MIWLFFRRKSFGELRCPLNFRLCVRNQRNLNAAIQLSTFRRAVVSDRAKLTHPHRNEPRLHNLVSLAKGLEVLFPGIRFPRAGTLTQCVAPLVTGRANAAMLISISADDIRTS